MRWSIIANARNQHFCGANKFSLGYFDEIRVFPRTVIERIKVLYLLNFHCCLLWKSQDITFKQAIEELERNFKIVGNYITGEKVLSHFNYEFIPRKIEAFLTSFFWI